MNITQLWHVIADNFLLTHLGDGDRASCSDEAYHSLVKGSADHVIVHGLGDEMPRYMSPSILALLGLENHPHSWGDVYGIIRAQRPWFHKAWADMEAQLRADADADAPILFAVPFLDEDGDQHWFTVCCGAIGTDSNGQTLVMALFIDLDTLGPVTPHDANGHDPAQELRERIDTLTKRESEVLALMLKGVGPSVIADTLFISVNTVQSHRRHIIEKTGVRSFVELVAALAALR